MDTLVATIASDRKDPEALIDLCLQGDRKAQHEIYRLYNRAMFNVCMRITNDFDEAQDVLQEAFVNAFRHLASFKRESTFGAWLKRIVVNCAVQHVKRRRLDMVPLMQRHNARADEDADPSAGSMGIAADSDSYTVERIRKAVQSLPDGYRTVLTLYLFEGYDHQEVADILGITESTSKSQLNRAKNKLRQILSESDEG